jgi:hypothetical protein
LNRTQKRSVGLIFWLAVLVSGGVGAARLVKPTDQAVSTKRTVASIARFVTRQQSVVE